MQNKFLSNNLLAAACIIMAFSTSCKHDLDNDNDLKTYHLTGNAQKGPFINGAEVVVYELGNNLSATGRIFRTSCNNEGYFDLANIELQSPYIEMVADGFYFDEVNGKISESPIKLRSIAAISEQAQININILTHLEFERVKHLVAQQNMPFGQAKIQAQNEVLKVFSCDSASIDNSEKLNIVSNTPGDGILLAISAILQGNRTTPQLSQMLADIITDMKNDGQLNDTAIIKSLKAHAALLNINGIKSNIKNRYTELGINIDPISSFEKYINNFKPGQDEPYVSPFNIPEKTSLGNNFLNPLQTELTANMDYSFAVNMPATGRVKIVITRIEGKGVWFYQPMRANGWQVSSFTGTSQEFTSTLNNQQIDLPFGLWESATAKVEYFFNDSETPSFYKIVKWGIIASDDYVFRNDSPAGQNLMALPDSSDIVAGNYVVAIYNDKKFAAHFKLFFNNEISVEVPGGWGNYTYELSENQLEFYLSGEAEPCEITLKLSGNGTLYLDSDIQNAITGNNITRVLFLKNQ